MPYRQRSANALIRVPTAETDIPSISGQKLRLTGLEPRPGVDFYLTVLQADLFGPNSLFLQLACYLPDSDHPVEVLLEPVITRSMFMGLGEGKIAAALLHELLFPTQRQVGLEALLGNAAAVVLTHDLESCHLKLVNKGKQEIVEVEVMIGGTRFFAEVELEKLREVVKVWDSWL